MAIRTLRKKRVVKEKEEASIEEEGAVECAAEVDAEGLDRVEVEVAVAVEGALAGSESLKEEAEVIARKFLFSTKTFDLLHIVLF